MSDAPFRCSAMSEAAGEPLTATASQVRNWLLIKHDGPWGRDAFAHARLLGDLGSALLQRTHTHDVRPILIRRSIRAADDDVTCFAVHSGPGTPWIERLQLEGIGAALDLDMEALGRGRSIGGVQVPGPLFLVCTHGRHDPCCAERGRPLALTTVAAFPDATWECSHIGGDRFAGNLVAFPHGLYFGRVGPEDGPRIARAYLAGRIDLDHYRGRSCYPVAVQAAERSVRVGHSLDGVDDIVVGTTTNDGPGTTVVLQTPAERLAVRVEVEAGQEQRLTCHSEGAQSPPRYRLLGTAPLSGADPGP
jgi:hypothetical protein